MKTEIIKLPKSTIEISCEILWEEMRGYKEMALEDLSKTFCLNGFRAGKAPKEIVEKTISKDKVLNQAAEGAVREKYFQFLKEQGIEPIGQPEVAILKLAENNPFCFKITVEVLPEIKLPDYQQIGSSIKKNEIIVETQELNEALSFIQKSKAEFEDLSTSAQEGNFVEIEYQSPQIQSNKLFKDTFLLGGGGFMKGFEEGLEGMIAGNEKEFELKAPNDYSVKDLAGKTLNFKVKMQKVQLMRHSEMNDDFAKGLGNFKDLRDFKDNLERRIKKEKENKEIQRWREDVLEKISEKTDFEIPESLVFSEKERLLEDFKLQVAKELNIDFQDYLKQIKKQETDLQEEFFKIAQKTVAHFLILREIGKQEKIKVEEAEIEQALNSFLTTYPHGNSQDIEKETLREYYRDILYNEKIFKKLESFLMRV